MSPAIAIGTCMWLEQQWRWRLSDAHASQLFIRRYLDDVLLVADTSSESSHIYDHIRSFTDECYPNPPLSLEACDGETYLESKICNTGANIHLTYWNKNMPSIQRDGNPVYWNTQPYHSSQPQRQRRTILSGTWHRIAAGTTRGHQKCLPIIFKAHEYIHLHGYPTQMVIESLAAMNERTTDVVWQRAANLVGSIRMPIWQAILDDNIFTTTV